MNLTKASSLHAAVIAGLLTMLCLSMPARAQTLLNIDFGASPGTTRSGMAATGTGTNDFWNPYSHYQPKFTPGMPMNPNGRAERLKLADGSESKVSIAVTNAPGVWGNSSGDPMFDTYMFSQNSSNITLTLTGLAPGSYHFYLYGHADPDVTGEQNSVFTLKTGTNTVGPLTASGGSGWRVVQGWQERAQFVVFRDVLVEPNGRVVIDVAPGPNGIAVINGLQVSSRGTSPPRLIPGSQTPASAANTNLMIREISYQGSVSDSAARFSVRMRVESMTTNEISAPLFEGDVALISPVLPKGLYIAASGKQTRLFCSVPGVHEITMELAAKITRAEPWNQVRFTGPEAAISSVSANAGEKGVEVELLSGTQVNAGADTAIARDRSQVRGFLSADRVLALRWQSKGAEVARKSLVTVDTTATAQVTPTVVKFTTTLRYEILQAPVPSLQVLVPNSHALTRLQGEQIRDWKVSPSDGGQVLNIEFIRPVEKGCTITLFSEQSVETTPVTADLQVPQPMGVERESGSFALSADDATVEIESAPGLRQVNAPAGSLAAYRFNTRPVSVTAQLRRVEPLLKMADRVTLRAEESRLAISHILDLTVEKAGIYGLDLSPQPGFVVTDVTGDGIEDWKTANGKIAVSFNARLLGTRRVTVQMEKPNREFPDRIEILPLHVAGVTNATTRVGAASSPGIRLKTAELSEVRETPTSALPDRRDELLAFVTEHSDWRVMLSAEKLPARVVSEVFNLVTIGDGLVGGSATIRYGIINQGVQEFKVSVPSLWKNIEFTGAMIRRKEQSSNVWTIALQDKAWGGYTLLITYDYQFDPKGATLDLGGAHTLGVERETGSLGIMTAASLRLTPAAPEEPLRRVDEAELSASDRALCTRPLLLAYKYTGNTYKHSVQVTRFEEVQVLDAVADRTELTTVLTEEGQLLTQASFMVKNNEKQFQRFKLPVKAELWSSYVNSQPAKPEKDGDWYLVPLPRDANRDQAFAVDIVYAQKIDLKNPLLARRIELVAPITDIPNTYAEWQLFTPTSQRVSGFKGNMTVASGTTYTLHDAWQQFLGFYGNVFEKHIGAIITGFVLLLLVALIGVAIRRGARGAIAVIVVFGIMAVLAAMLLPALSKAKAKAQRINAISSLKQIGLASQTWAADNGEVLPPNFEAMRDELGTDKLLIDPTTGQRFVYVGAGKAATNPEAIVAYAPSDVGGRAVLFADGSVQVLNNEKFDQAIQRDAAVPRSISIEGLSAGGNQPVPSLAPGYAGGPVTTVESDVATRSTATVPAETTRGTHFQGVESRSDRAATVTGVRPIRIEIPRAGQAFSFTKVINTSQEPLKLSISMMRLKTYRAVQMIVQVCAFLLGLGLVAFHGLRSGRHSLGMASGAALALFAIGSLLIMYRLLHVALILAVPAVLCLIAAGVFWRIQKRRRAAHSSQTEPPAAPPASALGTAAPLILGLILTTLGAGAQEAAPAPQPTFSVVSARYSGVVDDKVARFTAEIRILSSVTNQTIPLFGAETSIESFETESTARLIRTAKGLALYAPGKGEIDLKLRFVSRVGGDVSRRQLAFEMPAALASQVDLVIAEQEADVEFPSAVSMQRSASGKETRVSAVLGSSERFEMVWTPRVKRAAEVAATVFVQNTASINLGGGVMNTRSVLEYQVSQGELRQLRVSIPEDQRVLRVEGEFLRLWEMKDSTLVLDLLKGVSPSYKLVVETERVLDKLPATLKMEIPHALDVKRETGMIAYRGSEELSLTLASSQEVQRVDAEEFHRATPDSKEPIANAFRFLKPEFSLLVKAETVQPQLEAVLLQKFSIGPESSQLTAKVDFTIKRAGVFSLKLALPSGYKVESVAGPVIAQWVERPEGTARILEVSLKEKVSGKYSLTCVLSQNYKEVSAAVSIPGVHPMGTTKLTGFVTVFTEPGIAVKTGKLEGLSEIPYSSEIAPGEEKQAPGQSSALAYKFISASPGDSKEWLLTVTSEAVDAWVRAEIMNTVTLTETLVSGRTQIKYDIVNAPTREFKLRVPASFKNVEISGAQIRRRDQSEQEWRVELQGKVRGAYNLVVTWEMPKQSGDEVLKLEGIEAMGVERETGFLTVIARPPLQATVEGATELLTRVDVREVPTWAGQVDNATVLAYRYLRPGYALNLRAKRLEEAAVLQALVESANLTTVVADDGQVMTEMTLSIRNNGRQHLELALPQGSKIWSAFVAGNPVRPNRRDGKFLLPLTRDIATDAPIAINLTFVGSNPFPKGRGKVSLVSPTFDIPVKNARWDLFLPPDYEYSGFKGSMNRMSDSAAPMVQVFSLSEYKEQERIQETQQKSEIQLGLKAARQQLSGGNLREAVANFNRAKMGGSIDKKAISESELKDVETELRRAQSSNLIAAQNNYFYENAGRLEEGVPMQQQAFGQAGAFSGGYLMLNDERVAGEQWEKLAKAQQVAAAKVTPLRVNLPTRGVHYSFSQALQTETGKAMTVQLVAENVKAPGWFGRVLGAVIAFLVLWAVMALVSSRMKPQAV